MKIAYFTETFLPKVDGIVTILQITLDHLRARGGEALVFAAGQRVPEYAGFPVVSLGGVPTVIYPELSFALPGQAVRARLQAFDPDVIHVLNPVCSGLRGMQFAHQMGVPLIVSFHTHLMELARFYGFGVFEGALWALHRAAYQHADLVMATSERVCDQLRGRGFGEVALWRRGVDVQRFSPGYATPEMRTRLTDGHPSRTLLLSVGRLAPEKQVEQIAPVLDALDNVHLAIVGDGPHQSTLERAFAGHPVTFTGALRGDALSAAFASSDVFVFPSSSIETFGLVVAEAMASGLPVVASDVGGVRELIQHGENGLIVPENDTPALVGAVRRLAGAPDWREQVAARAWSSVQDRTWTAIMDDLLDVYAGMRREGPEHIAR